MRRLDLNRLSDQILVFLHQQFFDDKVEYITFKAIREGLRHQPANAIRLELNNLVASYRVIQESEERSNPLALLGSGGQKATQLIKMDGYQISKSGILHVEEWGEDYYHSLENDLKVGSSDLKTLPNQEIDWEPIPLDRGNLLQEDAIKALDRLAEELRGDNGYGATYPDEKVFVQDALSSFTKRLKEDAQISWLYINEFAFKPLGIIISRYGPAALGVTATLAKDALFTWLKSKGIGFLENTLK